MDKYDIHQMPIIHQAELEQETELVLQKAKQHGSLCIRGNDGHEIILMAWNDYLERFGKLCTKEELAVIQKVGAAK